MTKDIIIRAADDRDIKGILKLNFSLFKKEYREYDKNLNSKWTYTDGKKYFLNRINKNDGFVKVAEYNNKIIGYLCGGIIKSKSYNKKAKYAELENMFIEDKLRNRKVGTKLVKDFIHWCEQHKVDFIDVNAYVRNDKAILFYRKLGFNDLSLLLEVATNKLK